MPEGHVIHRQALTQRELLANQPLAVSSPQGRFALGARALDGHSIDDIEPVGKHLFYRWDSGSILHVHLGLFGRFKLHGFDAPPPTAGTRLAMRSSGHTVYLSGPTICELVDIWRYKDIVSRLGPDPLGEVNEDLAVEHIVERLQRRSGPIAEAILDQAVIAGVGNVYRSEVLFLCGINPLTSARSVSPDQVSELWREITIQLRNGLNDGRIVTTQPRDVGVDRRSRVPAGKRTYVYKRLGQPCRRCGAGVQMTEVSNRKIWFCPNCQSG